MEHQFQEGDVVLGNWTLVRLIGQGSFGRVFEARREEFGIAYKSAVKVITIPYSQSEISSARAEGMDDDSIRTYFQGVVREIVQEFSLMSRLKGTANVVSYEDHAVIPHPDGIGWDILIRMELLTPLLEYMSGSRMSRRDIIKLGIDMCRALELCQRFNIIHRDIKPENIFVSEMGDYKLGDFGIARTIEKTTGGMSKKGTYTYMAPEVYREEPYGSNVDIYSLGIVMYRLLNHNRAPFLPLPPQNISHSDREKALIRRISGEPLPKPANAEGRLAEIVMKACAYNPKERYGSPLQMRQELEAILYDRSDEMILYGSSAAIEVHTGDYSSTGSSKKEARPPHPSEKEPAPPDAPETDSEKTLCETPADKPARNPSRGRYQAPSKPRIKSVAAVLCALALGLLLLAEAVAGVALLRDRPSDRELNFLESTDTLPTQLPETAPPTQPAPIETAPAPTEPVKLAPIIQAATSWTHIVALRADGTVSVVIEDGRDYGQGNTEDWTDITAVCAGYYHTVGLKSDGTVVAVGSNSEGQCNVGNWTDIVAVSAGDNFTVGLKADGTVVATGNNDWGQCDVSSLKNIVRIGATNYSLQCLDAEGRWIKIGNDSDYRNNGQNLGIIELGAGHFNSLGIKPDGTALWIYKNGYTGGSTDVSGWSDLVSISANGGHIVGLRSDGTVLATGSNKNGECDVEHWADIVSISTGDSHTVGVKADGTVVVTGVYLNSGQVCDVEDLNTNTDTISDIHFSLERKTFCTGETLDTDSVSVQAVCESGETRSIYGGLRYSPSVLREPGTQMVTVSYGSHMESIDVEVIEFTQCTLDFGTIFSVPGSAKNVNWQLNVIVLYRGNLPATVSESFPAGGGPDGDIWEAAKGGQSFSMKGGPWEEDAITHEFSATYILPDNPSFSGEHSITVKVGEVSKTVTFTLTYAGDYTTGTGWEITNINWI